MNPHPTDKSVTPTPTISVKELEQDIGLKIVICTGTTVVGRMRDVYRESRQRQCSARRCPQ